MKKTILLFAIIACAITISTSVSAQKAVKSDLIPEYKLGVGTLLYGNSGFAFSNEFSIPVIKGFELGTYFIFGSTMPTGRTVGYYFDDVNSTTTTVMANSDLEIYNERSMYSINLMGYLRPLDFFKSTALKNHSIKIGGGYGFHHQTITGIKITNGITKLESLKVDIQSEFTPCFSLQYEYCIKNKWIVGTEYILFNPDGYGALNLLLGIRL